MAKRENTFLIKRSNVSGKIPLPGDLQLGELALNTADVKLYTSGTTENDIIQIGWDRIHRTGDTVTGDFIFNGDVTVTGTTNLNSVTASTVSNVEYIDFDINQINSQQEGRLLWDDDSKSLQLGLRNGNTLEVGQKNILFVVNDDSSQINKGEAVYVTSIIGDRVAVKKSIATSTLTSKAIGIALENIPSSGNNQGYIVTNGVLDNIDTLGFQEGEIIWLSDVVAGGITTDLPTKPNCRTRIGTVLSEDSTEGKIYINIQYTPRINSICDINTSGQTNGDLLTYNDSNGIWESGKELNGNYTISGDTVFNGSVDVVGNLNYQGSLNLTGLTGTIVVDDFYLEFSNSGLVKGSSSGEGLVYTDDYSDTFVNNSLVTKKFVDDGFVAINQQDGIIMVDDVEGDDSTAQPYRLDLPYKTIGAASLSATTGDIIVVRPGTYPESGIILPDGVTLRGDGSWPNVFIGSLSATTNIFELGINCTIRDVSLFMPSAGFASIYYNTALVTTDRSSVYSVNFIGDGSIGSGIGMLKVNNTGRLIGSDINCSTGGYKCIGKVEGGVMTLDNLRFATTLSGTIGCLFEAEAQATGTPRLQISGLNCGAPAIEYVVKSLHAVDPALNTNAPIIVMFNTNCVNATNFSKIECSGTFLGVYGGKINTSTTGFDVEVDPTVLAQNAGNTVTTVQITAAHQAKYSFPPAILGADLGLSFFSERTDTLEGALINLGADFVVGGPEIGSDSFIGRGRPTVAGNFVFTTDNTASPSSNGANFTNVSTSASTREGSTFTFQGTDAGHSILFTSARREEDSSYIRWYGLQVAQSIAASGGTFVFEIQTATDTWEEIRIQSIEKSRGFRYANFVLRRANSFENIAFGVDESTTWPSTTINGVPGRWARIRITSSPSILPVFEQFRIMSSHTYYSKDGYRNTYGLSKWKRSITVAGSVFSEDGNVGDTNITVGTGAVTWNQPLRDSNITSTSVFLGSQLTIPGGICTAFPLFITLYYVPYRTTNGTSTVGTPMEGTMVAIPMEVVGVEVADPSGGITPVPRALADTETLVDKSGVSFTQNLTNVGETVTGTSGREVRSVRFGPFFIEDYYEGDILFFRFGVNTFGSFSAGGGTPAFKMIGMDIEGIAFSDGKPQ